MSVRFDLSLFGVSQFSVQVLRVSKRAGSMGPVFKSTINRIREINAEQFRSEGLRGGSGWELLKPETIIEKARVGAPEPTTPLYRFGELFEAMTSPSSPSQIEVINDDSALWSIIGDVGQIGAWHQRGAGNNPVRRSFVLTEKDKKDFIREWQRYITRGQLGNFLDI